MSLKKNLLAGAVLATLAITTTSWAGPVLVLDLQVAGANSTAPSGVRTVQDVVAGQVINLQLWGTVQENASYAPPVTPATAAGDGIVSAAMRFVTLEGGISGNYSSGAKNTAGGFGLGNNGTLKTPSYDGTGGSDWGGAAPVEGASTSQTGYMVASTTSRVAFTSGTSVLLGTIQWTVGASPSGQATLNALPYISGINGRSQYNFMIGGVIYNNASDPASQNFTAVDTNQRIASGPGVTVTAVVPEPASLAMLGVGGLALLARRRK